LDIVDGLGIEDSVRLDKRGMGGAIDRESTELRSLDLCFFAGLSVASESNKRKPRGIVDTDSPKPWSTERGLFAGLASMSSDMRIPSGNLATVSPKL
jgi:hypothetical protein